MQQQQVMLTAQQVGQLLRHDVARPPAVRVALGRDRTGIDCVSLCHHQPAGRLAVPSGGESVLATGVGAAAVAFMVRKAWRAFKDMAEQQLQQKQLAVVRSALLGP